MAWPALLYILALLGLILWGIPVAFAMIAASAAYISLQESMRFVIIPHMMISGLDTFPLLAIPFFLFVGEIMRRSHSADRIVEFAMTVIGRVRGGAAYACIASGTMLGAVSGLAVADTALLSSIFVPTLKRRGYPGGFAAALSAGCGAIAPIMPPSVLMIVYGSLTGVSVARLFLGGVVPALLMGAYLVASSAKIARDKDYGTTEKASGADAGRSFIRALPSLLVAVIILGGIIGGIFTPTESAAVAAAYLVILGLISRSLSWTHLTESIGHTARVSGQVLFLIAASTPIRWILAVSQVQDPIHRGLQWLSGGSPLLLLFLITVFLLAIGCFIDALPTLTLLAPILFPIVTQAGIDPVHFGVVMTLALTIGFLTPPVGVCMYIVCAAGKVPLTEFLRHFLHIFVALVLVLWTLVLFPEIVLFLPQWVLD